MCVLLPYSHESGINLPPSSWQTANKLGLLSKMVNNGEKWHKLLLVQSTAGGELTVVFCKSKYQNYLIKISARQCLYMFMKTISMLLNIQLFTKLWAPPSWAHPSSLYYGKDRKLRDWFLKLGWYHFVTMRPLYELQWIQWLWMLCAKSWAIGAASSRFILQQHGCNFSSNITSTLQPAKHLNVSCLFSCSLSPCLATYSTRQCVLSLDSVELIQFLLLTDRWQ